MSRPWTAQGNVGATPELRYTPKGSAVCSFNLATDAGTDQDDNKLTTWVRVTCWKDVADRVAAAVHKGDKLQLQGHLDPPYIYPIKDEKGKPILDDNKHPVYGAAYQMTAWEVVALEWAPFPLCGDTAPAP